MTPHEGLVLILAGCFVSLVIGLLLEADVRLWP